MKGVKIDLEIYEQIRKLYVQEGLSQRAIAKKLGISRNTVKKYIDGDCVPWERKPYASSGGRIITNEILDFIKSCFEEDSTHNHKKQKHTAKRIYDRLVEELDFDGSYTAVRRAVSSLKENNITAYVPLEFDPGEALQIDFGTAYIYLNGKEEKIKYFCARLCFSAHIFAKAYFAENEECFLDGLVSSFEFFGGVPKSIIFDNGKVAVKDGYGAYVTKLSNGYQSLKSHYAFNTLFCNPRSGNEKGLVENLVGFIRRNTMVPLPRVSSINELNDVLYERCLKFSDHKIKGEILSVGEKYLIELDTLIPLPSYRYDIAKSTYTRVNSYSVITYATNKYSVPTKYVRKEVLVKASHSTIDIYCKDQLIASHQRKYTKNTKSYEIEHYLTLLERKPRAVFNAEPVRDFIPKEILDEYMKLPGGNKLILAYIRQQVDRDKIPEIQVMQTDLNSYDELIKGVN